MEHLSQEEAKKVVEKVKDKLAAYFKKNKKTYAIFGKSKGLDSSVVAGILADIPNIKPIGAILPIESETEDEQIAQLVLNHFHIPFLKIDLSAEYKELSQKLYYDNKVLIQLKQIAKSYKDNNLEKNLKTREAYALGNIKVRLRMITLYHLAQLSGGVVVGTGNLSEYWTGFWTLHGDVGDINPLAPFYKGRELYDVAKFLDVPQPSLDAVPSDGLNITKKGTDEDQLGLDYKNLDKVIYYFLQGKNLDQIKSLTNLKEDKINKTLERIKMTQFKRDNPITFTRKELDLKV